MSDPSAPAGLSRATLNQSTRERVRDCPRRPLSLVRSSLNHRRFASSARAGTTSLGLHGRHKNVLGTAALGQGDVDMPPPFPPPHPVLGSLRERLAVGAPAPHPCAPGPCTDPPTPANRLARPAAARVESRRAARPAAGARAAGGRRACGTLLTGSSANSGCTRSTRSTSRAEVEAACVRRKFQ